eukprot:6191250-Pleurochrysis_carterae.AAC.4
MSIRPVNVDYEPLPFPLELKAPTRATARGVHTTTHHREAKRAHLLAQTARGALDIVSCEPESPRQT